MDIYETLHKEEHKKVTKIIKEIEGTSPSSAKMREKLFDQLKNMFEMHSRSEEQVFYPLLKRNESSHFMALEAAEEHHMVDLLLGELASMSKEKEEWLAKLSVLKDAILHHVDEEESELFSQARDLMNKEQAEEMAARFEEQKTKFH